MDHYFFTILLYLTATTMFGLAYYSWQHRTEPIATPFALGIFFGAWWALTYGLEISASSLEAKIGWPRVRFLFIPFLPVAWFTLSYAIAKNRLIMDRWNILMLSIIPTITALLSLTGEYHRLFRFNYSLYQAGTFSVLQYENGPWLWVYLLFAYVMIALTLFMLVRHMWQGSTFQRRQAALVSAGIFLPLVSDMLFQAGITPVTGYNFSPNILLVTAFLMGFALFRYKLISVVPIARNTLVENLPDAMLVLDEKGRIIDFNPAAVSMFDVKTSHFGQHVENIITNWQSLTENQPASEGFVTELSLTHPETQRVELRITPIEDKRGRLVSRLVVFHDITERSKAQQALQDSHTMYQVLVDSMPIGIFRKNLEGQYTFVNRIYCERIKKPQDDIMGKTDWELYPEKAAQRHARSDRNIIQTGISYEAIEIDERDTNKLGYTEIIKIPVHDKNGDIVGIQGIFWDITERRKVEEEFKQRMNELAVINTVNQAISAELDLNALLELIAEKLMEMLNVQSLYIALHDRQHDEINIPYFLNNGKRIYDEKIRYGEGLTSHILKTKKPLVINQDYMEKSHELGVKPFSSGKVSAYPKSWIGVPIIINGQAIGVIGASDNEIEYAFHKAELNLLTTVATNIGIALQKAQLYEAAQKEIRERQRAEEELARRLQGISLVNEVSRAASSKLDLANLVNFVGKKLEEVFLAKSVFVALLNKETEHIEVPYWTIELKSVSAAPLPLGQGLTSIVLSSRKPLLINENFEARSKELGAVLKFTNQYGYPKTWLGVPMIYGDNVIGVISIQDYDKENAYSDFEINLLSTIATNIAISVENARLYNETIRRAEEISLIYRLGITITSNLDLNNVLREILEGYRNILPMDAFFVAIFDDESRLISYPLFFDRGQYLELPTRNIDTNPGITGYVINNGKTVYIPDTLEPGVQKQFQFMHVGGEISRSSVSVPLTVHNRVIGVISMQSYQPDSYSRENIHLLETIAPQAATAIENSQLYAKIQMDNIALQEKIREIDALQSELREQAIRDPLTDLFNRRYLQETLTRELARMIREEMPLSIIMLDIDKFKNFNDTFGHATGDALLKALASLLKLLTREADIACRYGGEEFLVVMPGSTLENATKRAEEIRQRFANTTVSLDGNLLNATVSLGVSCYPLHGQTNDALIKHADQALYTAKNNGRNRVIVYSNNQDQ